MLIDNLFVDGRLKGVSEEKIKNKIMDLAKKYENRDIFVRGLNQYNANIQLEYDKKIEKLENMEISKANITKMNIKEHKKRLLRLKKDIFLHMYAKNTNYTNNVVMQKKK